MAVKVGSLLIEVAANVAKVNRDLQQIDRNVKSFGKGVETTMDRAKKAFGAVFTFMAAKRAMDALQNMIQTTIDTGDAIAKMSTRIGISTEALSALHYASERAGIDVRTLDMAFQRMVRRVSEAAKGTGEARDAIKELGLDAKYLATLSPDKQFLAIAKAMERVGDSGSRVRLAMRLFDSEGVRLLQLINQGETAIRGVMREAENYGAVITSDFAQASEQAKDAITAFNAAVLGLKITFVEELLPGITRTITELTRMVAWIRQNKDEIQGFLAGLKFGAIPGFTAQGRSEILMRQLGMIPGGEFRGGMGASGAWGGGGGFRGGRGATEAWGPPAPTGAPTGSYMTPQELTTRIRMISSEIRIYEELFRSQQMTAERLEAVWERYATKRKEQIQVEAEALKILGVDAGVIQMGVEARTEELERRLPELLRNIKQRTLSIEIGIYEEVVRDQTISEQQLRSIWTEYSTKRRQQIELESEVWKSLGVDVEIIQRVVQQRIAEIDHQFADLQNQVRGGLPVTVEIVGAEQARVEAPILERAMQVPGLPEGEMREIWTKYEDMRRRQIEADRIATQQRTGSAEIAAEQEKTELRETENFRKSIFMERKRGTQEWIDYRVQQMIAAGATEAEAIREGFELQKRYADELGLGMADGVRIGAQQVSDTLGTEAGRWAEITETSIMSMTTGFTDFFVEAIRGTKDVGEAFRAMADQIIADLIRIMIQKAIVEPIAGGILGVLGIGHEGGAVTAQGVEKAHSGAILDRAWPIRAHAGGVVESWPISSRQGPVLGDLFVGATRFHDGGMVGGGPAGATVVTDSTKFLESYQKEFLTVMRPGAPERAHKGALVGEGLGIRRMQTPGILRVLGAINRLERYHEGGIVESTKFLESYREKFLGAPAPIEAHSGALIGSPALTAMASPVASGFLASTGGPGIRFHEGSPGILSSYYLTYRDAAENVGAFEKKYHVGTAGLPLGPGEVPIIAEAGEAIIPKKVVNQFPRSFWQTIIRMHEGGVVGSEVSTPGTRGGAEKPIKVEINMENKSGVDLEMEQQDVRFDMDRYIVDTVVYRHQRSRELRQNLEPRR